MASAGDPTPEEGKEEINLLSRVVDLMEGVALTNSRLSKSIPVKPLLKALLSGKKFGSQVSSLSLRAFLHQLRQINEVEDVPVPTILEYLSVVLEGKALEWWTANHQGIITLSDVEEGLNEIYLGVDWRGKIRADFLLRMQGEGENISQYVTVLSNMALCMGSKNVAKEVYDRAATGMRPEYYDYFRPRQHRDLEGLIEVGKEVEICLATKARYRPPPPKERCWAPDFAADPGPSPNRPHRHTNIVSEPNLVANVRPIRKCFVCQGTDHLMRDCPTVRELRNVNSGNPRPSLPQ